MGFWIAFHLFILGMVYLDVKVFHKRRAKPQIGKSLYFAAFWVLIALLFAGAITLEKGGEAGLTFLTAYVLEASLSLDNLFVFLSIFSFLQIPFTHQHRVLFYGILGALFFRITFILSGIALVEKFSWMFYLFGGILCISAFYLYRQKEENTFQDAWMMKVATRLLPFKKGIYQGKFFIKEKGKRYGTTLCLALVLIELSDILFAVDSVPAVLSITSDPFLAYTSNVFAVLGLRSFYFFLFCLHKRFVYLKRGIVLLLLFIGIKLLLIDFIHIPSSISLIFILLVLSASIALSWIQTRKPRNR